MANKDETIVNNVSNVSSEKINVNDKSSNKPVDDIVVRDLIRRSPPQQRQSREPTKSNNKSNVSNKPRSSSTFRSPSLTRSMSSSSLKKRKMNDSPVDQSKVKSTPDLRDSNVKSTKDVSKSQVKHNIDINIESDDSKCGDCSKTFRKDDSCVYCDCCNRCFHAACQGVSEEKVTALKILANTAYYYCNNCDAGAKELYKLNVVLKNRIDSLDKTVAELSSDHASTKSEVKSLQSDHEKLANKVSTNTSDVKSIRNKQNNAKTDIDSLKGNQTANEARFKALTDRLNALEPSLKNDVNAMIDEKLNKFKEDNLPAEKENDRGNVKQIVNKLVVEEFNKLKDDNFPALPDNMEVDNQSATNTHYSQSTFENKVNDIFKENKEIEKRKNQLIIMNFKENQNAEADKKEVRELFNMLNVNEELLIERADRMGEKRNDGKPRFLRVDMKSVHMKRKVLEKASQLRDVPETHKFHKVFIKPNLTKNQQAQSKNLQAQLMKERDKNPGVNMKIHRGKIIIVPSQD